VRLEDTENSHRSALSLSLCLEQNACQSHSTLQRNAPLAIRRVRGERLPSVKGRDRHSGKRIRTKEPSHAWGGSTLIYVLYALVMRKRLRDAQSNAEGRLTRTQKARIAQVICKDSTRQ
jgi:hypothetical protein